MCGGGGGTTSTTSTVTGDPVYNAGLLELMRGDSETAKEYDNFFRYGVFYDPTEAVNAFKGTDGNFYASRGEMPPGVTAVDSGGRMTLGEVYGYDPDATVSGLEYATQAIAAQSEILPAETSAYRADLGAQESTSALTTERNRAEQGLIGSETGLRQSEIDTGLATNALTTLQANTEAGYYPSEREAAHATTMATSANDLLEAQQKNALIPDFFNEAMNYDVEGKVNQAGADAVQAFKNSGTAMRQRAAQTGVNPSSGTFANAFRNEALDKTRAVGTARVQARDLAEKEKFNRLTTAYNI